MPQQERILLPLDDVQFMRCALRNARVYYSSGELVAARYELGLALSRLRRLQRLYAW